MTNEGLNVKDISLEMQHFGFLDYSVFGLMLLACVAIGLYFGYQSMVQKRGQKERRGSEALNYLMGGRQMKIVPVAISLVASYVSGISLMGTSTEMYIYGSGYGFLIVSMIIGGFLLSYIFLPVYHDLQITSTYEYLQMRFDKRIRLFGSILFTIGTICWLPIVIYVPALAFNQVTGANVHIVTPVVCIICIFYTCVGGLKAVVWTDVVQSAVMVGALIFVQVKGTIDIGGYGVVWQRNIESGRIELPELTLDPTVRHSMLSLWVGGLIFWTQITATNQCMLQRYLSLPTLADARKALWLFVFGVIGIILLCCYNGFLIYATYHDCDPLSTKLIKAKDQLLPLLVMKTMGSIPGMPGVFVAGVFSAALSSLSTGLNSLAAIGLEDFYKPFSKTPLSEKQTSYLMRTVVIVCGAISVGLVFLVEKLGAVLQLSASLGSMTNGALFGIFLLGLLVPCVGSKSALTGGICSLIAMSYICLKAQTDIATGALKFEEKPVSIVGCTYNFNSTAFNYTESPVFEAWNQANDDDSFKIQHISYLWYTTLGTLITMVVAVVSCLFFGFQDARDVDPSLLCPFIRKLIKPRKSLSVRPDLKERTCVIHAFEEKNTELN